jgi:hypothetical protein
MADDDNYGEGDPDPSPAGDAPKETQTAESVTDTNPSDKSGAMHKDAGDTTPDIPADEEGHAEGYVPGVTQPYTSEEKMKIALDQTRASRDSLDKLQARTQPMWQKYRAMLQQDQNSRESSGDTPTPPPPGQGKGGGATGGPGTGGPTQRVLGAISQLLAVAVPVAMMFGLKGNGYAKGAMMSAMGSFLNNYAKGRKEASEEAWKDWKQQVSAIKESNKERHQLYKDTLADKRLALDDQMKMIHSYSQEFHDPIMAKASRTKNMNAIIKHLENQEKVQQRFAKQADKTAKVLRPTEWQNYKRYMLDKHHVDPDTDPEAADKILNYTDWKNTESTPALHDKQPPAPAPGEPSAEEVHKLFE